VEASRGFTPFKQRGAPLQFESSATSAGLGPGQDKPSRPDTGRGHRNRFDGLPCLALVEVGRVGPSGARHACASRGLRHAFWHHSPGRIRTALQSDRESKTAAKQATRGAGPTDRVPRKHCGQGSLAVHLVCSQSGLLTRTTVLAVGLQEGGSGGCGAPASLILA